MLACWMSGSALAACPHSFDSVACLAGGLPYGRPSSALPPTVACPRGARLVRGGRLVQARLTGLRAGSRRSRLTRTFGPGVSPSASAASTSRALSAASTPRAASIAARSPSRSPAPPRRLVVLWPPNPRSGQLHCGDQWLDRQEQPNLSHEHFPLAHHSGFVSGRRDGTSSRTLDAPLNVTAVPKRWPACQSQRIPRARRRLRSLLVLPVACPVRSPLQCPSLLPCPSRLHACSENVPAAGLDVIPRGPCVGTSDVTVVLVIVSGVNASAEDGYLSCAA